MQENVSIIKVSVPNAENVRSGGHSCVNDDVVAWIGEHNWQTALRLYDPGNRPKECDMLVYIVRGELEQGLHSRVAQDLTHFTENEGR